MKIRPVHPRTGLAAVGFRRNGAPIWPILGASDDPPETDPPADPEGDDPDGDPGDDPDDPDDSSLGDAGKQALDRMKEQRRAERERRKTAEQELTELRKELDKLKAGNTDDPPPFDADAIRAEVEAEVTRKAHERILRSEIKAAATGRMADPSDAVLYLDLSDFEVGADGTVDESEIADAIRDLVEAKPHLAAAQGGGRGSGDGGARNGRAAKQLTREDLDSMSPEDIAKARREGRLNKLLGVTG